MADQRRARYEAVCRAAERLCDAIEAALADDYDNAPIIPRLAELRLMLRRVRELPR